MVSPKSAVALHDDVETIAPVNFTVQDLLSLPLLSSTELELHAANAGIAITAAMANSRVLNIAGLLWVE
jgi:hypothetical protein